MLYPLFKSIAFRMDPEKVHERTLKLLQKTARPGKPHFMAGPVPDKPVEMMGLRFANPVGLAAGMDKDGTCIDGLASLGFGFLELGTVTPLPQPGNPKPRLFRLPEHEGVINRMGFNNGGVNALLDHLSQARYQGIVGINIGKNFNTPIERAEADYVLGLRAVYKRADYVTVNISSPNTSNLRELQKGDAFTDLLRSIADTRKALMKETGVHTPIAVKIAPDLDEAQLDFIVEALLGSGMDAVIATNTTLDRTAVAGHPRAEEAGGLSGAPVRQRSTEIIKGLSKRLDGKMPIIGVGGIFSADDAKEKLDAGAKLVQVYSGLIYRGPGLISEIVNGL
ncbi:quinone-dependent dihydroorotate dehydrogenase [Kiritimatiellaeota bacterium B1221]|nr:quinone-dependent dihydroorotate dehydrogenase [Kiritimatiellaeota bacterium B1221]